MSQLPLRSTPRCIYCAFRSHQLTLQARRHRSSPPGNADVEQMFQGFSSKRKPPSRTKDASWTGGRSNQRAERRGDQEGRFAGAIYLKSNASGGLDRARSFKTSPNKRAGPYKGFGGGNAESYTDVLRLRMQGLRKELKNIPLLDQIRKEQEEAGEETRPFEDIWNEFVVEIAGQSRSDDIRGNGRKGNAEINQDLEKIFHEQGQAALDNRIKYHFYGHLTNSRFTSSEMNNQRRLADLRFPTEWYPATRTERRTIHLHVGPTNSGKTYHALQALEKGKSGMYAGPLRLLAHEVYSRMNAKGRPCVLVTGEERRLPEGSESKDLTNYITSCTVEMVPINTYVDVAVIDEIQMIGNSERGWAWTQALMGIRTVELHLCGEVRTVPLIKELAASMGEELVIHHYERLSPLEVAQDSLNGDLSKLRKGDCIVSFSIMGIHALRKQIEERTGKKVATVYGSLPPETRAQQARLFNDPDNDYDFLVASDAVGMGLNLAIKRIIFEASSKFNGYMTRPLSIADVKQIAGRAGRYRTASQATETPTVSLTESQDSTAAEDDRSSTPVDRENVGIVTTLEGFDLPVITTAMSAEPEPIRTAGIFPPAAILERFAAYFPPGTPFSYIMTRLHELSQMHSRFHLCGLRDQVWVADMIEPIQGLSVMDRTIITAAPASRSDAVMWKSLIPALASCIAEQKPCNIADLAELPLEILEEEPSANRSYLQNLERLHKGLVTYLWLSYRFAGVFNTRALARHAKALVEEKIETALRSFSYSEAARKRIVRERQQMQQMLFSDMQMVFGEDGGVEQKVQTDSEADEDSVEDGTALTEDMPTSTPSNGVVMPPDDGEYISAEKDDVLFDEPERAEIEEGQYAISSSTAGQSSQLSDTSSAVDAHVDIPDAAGGVASEETAAAAAATLSPAAQDASTAQPAVYGANVPPKHLANLDVDATELERDAAVRP